MADFSQYTGPSEDWIALEPTLPPMPKLPILELRALVNKGREELAAHGMASIGMYIEDHTQQLTRSNWLPHFSAQADISSPQPPRSKSKTIQSRLATAHP